MANCTIEIYFEWYKTSIDETLYNCGHCGDLIVGDVNILSMFVNPYVGEDILKVCNSCKNLHDKRSKRAGKWESL